MVLHRAALAGSRRSRAWIDPQRVEACVRGEAGLLDALGLDPAFADELRGHALALLRTGQWQRAIDVVLGAVALGTVHPADALMLARAYRGLGKNEVAARCESVARGLLEGLGIEVPAAMNGD